MQNQASPAVQLIIIALAYLLGSIPFSYLVVKLFAGEDLRQMGSGNVGATNVLRNFGKLPGLMALALDIAKGWCAVSLAGHFLPGSAIETYPFAIWQSRAFWLGLTALTVVLGHIFPVWLGFRGGKGVATATGAFLALDPRVVAGAVIVFAIVLILSRFVSLASMVAAAAIPLLFRFLVQAPLWIDIFSILVSMAVILKHHENVGRLVHGNERKLGSREDKL